MKKILVPTDFSEASQNAIRAAMVIGRESNAELILFHCSLPSEGLNNNVYSSIFIHEYHEIKRNNLIKIAEELKSQGYPGTIAIDHQIDFTVPAVVNASATHDVDLVVMGSTGASGLSGIILGSTAGGVLSKISHPILVVPKSFVLTSLGGNLIVGVDFVTPISDISQRIIQFFKDHLEYKITIAHVEKDNNPLTNQQGYIDTFLQGMSEEDYVTIQGDKIGQSLIEIKEKYPNSILATVTRQRNWFENIFSNSVSKSLAHHADLPLLCLHERE